MSQKFTSDSSNNSSSLKFDLPLAGTDLKLDYAGGSLVDVTSYKFESGLCLKTLASVPGAKLTLKGKVGGDMSVRCALPPWNLPITGARRESPRHHHVISCHSCAG
eukprot:COSAG01_NODE_19_length_39011_cov_38.134968_41_plen_106_part_00